VTAAASPINLPQSSTEQFDVTRVLARSKRRIMISRRSSAAVRGSLRMPKSSMMSSGTATKGVVTAHHIEKVGCAQLRSNPGPHCGNQQGRINHTKADSATRSPADEDIGGVDIWKVD